MQWQKKRMAQFKDGLSKGYIRTEEKRYSTPNVELNINIHTVIEESEKLSHVHICTANMFAMQMKNNKSWKAEAIL